MLIVVSYKPTADSIQSSTSTNAVENELECKELYALAIIQSQDIT